MRLKETRCGETRGKVEYRNGEDRTVTGTSLPVNERGHGSRLRHWRGCDVAVSFERVSIATYLNRCGIPNEMMEEGMSQRMRTALELVHPNAARIDIGSASHFVAMSQDRDDESAREFKSS